MSLIKAVDLILVSCYLSNQHLSFFTTSGSSLSCCFQFTTNFVIVLVCFTSDHLIVIVSAAEVKSRRSRYSK